ncbi:GNAT family N-acetyltransferase [Bacillus infantis]|uniref:GNAT family N-acetyltransferase n=1 Tax=Bacillus infantis TaxID=324767 RepID=UPI003CF24570
MDAIRFLQGERIYLRPISTDDTDIYVKLLYNEQSRKLTGLKKAFSKDQIFSYIKEKAEDSSSILLLIVLDGTNEVIGDIALQDIDSTNRNANIRVNISEEENQGRGYGSEAMELMLGYAFGVLNLHRIELNVFVYNDRALHVYEKLGFKQEGVQREALFYDHQYHDSIMMSILEDDYRRIHLEEK